MKTDRKFSKKWSNVLTPIFLVLLSSCSSHHFLNQQEDPSRSLATASPSKSKGLPANKRAENFSLSNKILGTDGGREMIKEAFSEHLEFYEVLSDQGYEVTRDVDLILTEGNFLKLIEQFPKFKTLLEKYTEKIRKNGTISKTQLGNFLKDFKALNEYDEITQRAGQLKPYEPYVLRPANGKTSTRHIDVFANHDMVLDSGKTIRGVDLVEKKRKFIRGLKGEIMVNVYDFDIIEIADELIAKSKAGHKVTVGIDDGNVKEKEGVAEVAKKLKKNGVIVVNVDSVGLNHQKIIAGGIGVPGQGKVILSSGNFTYSGIHRDGDLGAYGAKHELSYPNANHFVEIHDDQLTALVKHQLDQTLEMKLRGKHEYPLSSAYQIIGPQVKGYGQTNFTIAFSPNGGLKNIMANIMTPEIKSNIGPMHLTTFAFSSNGAVADAIYERAKKQVKESKKPFEFMSVGDASFSVREWAAYTEMNGMELVRNDDAGTKVYKETDNRWTKLVGKKGIEKIRKNTLLGPEAYGRHSAEVDGVKYQFEAKVHHKLMALSDDIGVLGNSANFSDLSSTNIEQFFMAQHPKIAEKTRGIVRGLARDSKGTVYSDIMERNKSLIPNQKAIIKQLKKISKMIIEDKPMEDIEEAARELKQQSGYDYEEVKRVILAQNKFYESPDKGSRQVNYSFDLDDNVFNLDTTIEIEHKETGETKELATSTFADVKGSIGVAGTEYEDYQYTENSFANFRDTRNSDQFLQDLLDTQENKPDSWKGPVFERFADALSTPEGAARTTIVTARGHEPASILKAMRKLQRQGYIEHLPKKDNIFCIMNPNFPKLFKKRFGKRIAKASADSPSKAKVEVLVEILDEVNDSPFPRLSDKFLTPEGQSREKYHLWGFSDDDYDNFAMARDELQRHVDEGRWPNIKVALYYTGPNNEDVDHREIVLRPNDSPRKLKAIETIEWVNALFGVKSPGQYSCQEAASTIIKNP